MALWLLLIACGVPEDAFPDAAGDAVCDRLEECTTTFDTDGERADCEAFWSGTAELWIDLGDLLGSEYDPGLGADCLREIRSASCAEFNSLEYSCDVLVSE